MTIYLDIPHLDRFGWMRVEDAVPVRLCERLVEVLEAEMGVPVHNQSRWHEHGAEPRDLIPIWGHQAQWDIRQHPNLHRIWARLWKTDRLRMWLDSCRFTPPWKPGFAEPLKIHWDYDPWNAEMRKFQGVVAPPPTRGASAASRRSIKSAIRGCERRSLITRAPKTGSRRI